jgi:hypothetical protein
VDVVGWGGAGRCRVSARQAAFAQRAGRVRVLYGVVFHVKHALPFWQGGLRKLTATVVHDVNG